MLHGPPSVTGIVRDHLRHVAGLTLLGRVLRPQAIEFAPLGEAYEGFTADDAAIRDLDPPLYLSRLLQRAAGLPVIEVSPGDTPLGERHFLSDSNVVFVSCQPDEPNDKAKRRLYWALAAVANPASEGDALLGLGDQSSRGDVSRHADALIEKYTPAEHREWIAETLLVPRPGRPFLRLSWGAGPRAAAQEMAATHLDGLGSAFGATLSPLVRGFTGIEARLASVSSGEITRDLPPAWQAFFGSVDPTLEDPQAGPQSSSVAPSFESAEAAVSAAAAVGAGRRGRAEGRLMAIRPLRRLRIAGRQAKRLYLPHRHGRDLNLAHDNTGAIRPSDVLLVTCLRNELIRLPYFLEYYRNLGVDHFLIIDNDSTDGFPEWIKQHDDCSVWHTKASYRASGFGMHWCNYLLGRFGHDHLCVTVDTDEFLVYPHMATRNLRRLGQFLTDDERVSMHALLVDAYGAGTLTETCYASGEDPFAVCPFFDRDGYIQRPAINFSTHVQGGPRMRVYNRDRPRRSPALNKIPVVWWKRHYTYLSSTHDAWPPHLNRAHSPGKVSLTACLLHFKLLNSLLQKAEEEAVRRQHYDSGHEYGRYRSLGDVSFYEAGISVRYESPEQLIELGLMSPGNWT